MTDKPEVCDGCWKRGFCVKRLAPEPWEGVCRCPCVRDGWHHQDYLNRTEQEYV